MRYLGLHIVAIVAIGAGLLASSAVVVASTVPKEVALTFDDGPYGTSTQQVLDILQQQKVVATFFLIGQNIQKYPALAKEIVAEGNMVGNHTFDHPKNLTRMTMQQVSDEVSTTELAIASSTGVHAVLFRPPYGSITRKLRKELREMGYTVVLWNVDPRDWDASSTGAGIVDHILHHLQNHMIIVLHDGRDTHIGYPRDNLITALPILIADLKQRGYTFVTVDKLVPSH